MSPEAILGSLQGGTMAAAGRGAVACREAGDRGVCRGEGLRHWHRCRGPLRRERACLHRRWTGVGRLGRGPGERTVPAEAGTLARRPEPVESAVGLRFPWIDSRLWRPCRRRRARIRGQRRWRSLCAGPGHGMHPLELHGGSVGARGAERRPIEGWPHRGLLRRSGRAALRARRGAWHSALANRGGRPDRSGDHRRTQAARRTALRSDLGRRGHPDTRSQISLLPGARRARRGRCGNRKDPLESPLRRRSSDEDRDERPPAPIAGAPRARASGTPPPSTR